MKRTIPSILILFLLLTACGGPASSSEDLAPTWQEQYDLGVRYLSEGNYEEAIIAFTAAIEIDPKRAEAYVGRGDAYVLSGETEENLTAARTDYETAIGLDDTLADAYLGLADVYIRQGDYDKALEILQQGLEKTGENQDIADKISEIKNGNYEDSSGNVRKIITYDQEGNIIYYLEFEYSHGQRTMATSYNGTGEQTNQLSLTYDSNGNPLYSYLLWNDGIIRGVSYEYDSHGNKIKSTEYDLDGSISVIGTNTYDSENRLIQTDWSRGDSQEIFGSYVYEYNSQGLKSKQTHTLSDGRIAWYKTFEYNSEGQVTKESTFEENGQLQSYYIHHYDASGKRLGYDQYDSNGNVIKSTMNN